MNISDSEGEPSCKRQENGDASNGSDRPHKKARFAWQVKGKYHLKNENTDTSKSCSSSNVAEQVSSTSSNKNECRDILGHTEQNLEILGDYLLKQDFNTLDSVIGDTEKSLLKPSTSISTEKLPYPRYISSYDSNSSGSSQCDNSLVNIPMSLVTSQSYNEDQCIARWQARQMAKGFVDNTINRVLDSWMIAPLPAEVDNRILALDVAEFINNLPGDNSIENEGILMAISAHGLQNNLSSDSSSEQSTMPPKDIFPSPTSPAPSDDENNLNKNHNDIDKSNEVDLWSCNDVKRTVGNSITPLSLYPDNSSSSYHCFSENYTLDQQLAHLDNEIDPSPDNDYSSHFDFMDAAVTFAIQNKGLTSFGSEYG